MSNQVLTSPEACPECGANKRYTLDQRTFCFMCDAPLVSGQSVDKSEREPSIGILEYVETCKRAVHNSEYLTSLWQKFGHRRILLGGGVLGVVLLGSGVLLSTKNIPSSVAIGSGQTTVNVLGDTYVGYAFLRADDFQADLKETGMDLAYKDQFNQAARANALASGEADLIVTTLEQVVKHQPDGQIVAMLDHTIGADVVVLNTDKFPLLTSMDALADEAELAAQSGQRYSIVYAADTPSEYLALLLANKYPKFRLDQFDLVPVNDASEAYAQLQDPTKNIAIAILWEPFVTPAVRDGHTVALSSKDVPENIVDVLVASNDFIESKPEQLRQFIAAHYGRVNSFRLDATGLKQQLGAEARLQLGAEATFSSSEEQALLDGIHFFNAREASDWLIGGKLSQKIDFAQSILKASNRLPQDIEQPERFFTGKFLDLAIAQKNQLEQQLSGNVEPIKVVKRTPQPIKVAKRTPQPIRENIQFELSGVLLDEGDQTALDTFIATAKGLGPEVPISITGHSSESSSEKRKADLSKLNKRQVESVATYLRGQGMDQLTVKRVGSDMPLPEIPPTDPRNQRVEIAVNTGG